MTKDTTRLPQLADILFSPDRDAAFARLREGPAVVAARYFDGTGVWLVTRYDDIVTVLTDRRFSSDVTRQTTLDLASATGLPDDVAPYFTHTFGTYDPPDHTRLRTLVSREFTARRVQRLRPRIQQIVDELLDAVAGAEEFDLIDRFAMPLPLRVICELLGVPAADQERWHDWSRDLTAPDPERIAAGARALVGDITALIEEKRKAPAEDLLSALLQVRENDGDRLSAHELTSISLSILLGGHQTTVDLIGSGTFLLLTHPEQRERLRAQPDQIPTAVEELLRYAGPADIGVMRYTLEPVQIGGVTIPAGEAVQVLYATGNRDPRRFSDPDRLALDRADNPHLAFARGPHYCLGAALARAEGDIAFRGLVSRFPRLTLAVHPDQLTWKPGPVRTLGTLPVRPGPSRPGSTGPAEEPTSWS
ncbi:6-deoxyerythronolide B hydroxylase [Prauserella shujinwangii]|uniref:6-deoxyerythronolide B hydroxylase n=1 Tax=Prauserella shujinwangii TaxID=1453103 RepID=A0A2T0LTD3_9PSEU|nr:cytochrome P450 [Prauserella shujinwangii]PRX46997.1 6-deoxyerythronolide B hydroxylase [Prauserella shujinwangii]